MSVGAETVSSVFPSALVRCLCGETEAIIEPGMVVPRLVCPDCPSDPAEPLTPPRRPVLTLVKS